MGCRKCDDTGWVSEHERETGFVDAPCPDCRGRDGEEPDIVTEGHDALTEMEKEGYTFASTKQGLAASGHLLIAKAHLRKAKDGLGTKQAMRDYMAGEAITRAMLATRHAQKLLKEE